MKITYDPEVDALYVQLRDSSADHGQEIEPGVIADIDSAGHVIGLQVLDATERLGGAPPSTVTLEWLTQKERV